MSEPRHRKLTAMGIASLVSTGRPEVLQRLPIEIFNLWIDVFCEIKEARISAENDRARSVQIVFSLVLARTCTSQKLSPILSIKPSAVLGTR